MDIIYKLFETFSTILYIWNTYLILTRFLFLLYRNETF